MSICSSPTMSQEQLEFLHLNATQNSTTLPRKVGAQLYDCERPNDLPDCAPYEQVTVQGRKKITAEQKIAERLSEDWTDAEPFTGPSLRLYCKEDVVGFVDTFVYGESEVSDRAAIAVNDLLRLGNRRELAQLGHDFLDQLRALNVKFPQFFEVIEYVAGAAMIAMRSDDRVLRLTPILLTGDPGVGKTAFSNALASTIGTSLLKIDMAASQNNSELIGTSSFFSNARPGKLFTFMARGDIATGKSYGNVLILLDEVDKAAQVSANMQYDPTGPLYSLLEPESSVQFTDSFIHIPLDLSACTYIATANSSSLLPAPLYSRFREFKITITSDQAEAIAKSIANDVLEEIGDPDLIFHALSITALSKLASARAMRQRCFEAIGRALLAQREVVSPSDVGVVKGIQNNIGFL
jgi:ATP-dependent Lon protease